jgi:hypothetical protein
MIKYKTVIPIQNRTGSRLGDEKGMNLREYFASQAMAALAPHFTNHHGMRSINVAKEAVELADALCEELERRR